MNMKEFTQKMKISDVGITYNLKDKTRIDDLHEEYDEIETIEAIGSELREMGFSVVFIEQTLEITSELLRVKPDMVFNISEGIGKTRSRESQVPCVLESLGIPYTGSDPLSLGVTLDKYLTNTVLEKEGIPVPRAFTASNQEETKKISLAIRGEGKWIVKPRWEGSSKGIFDDSLVSSGDELIFKSSALMRRYEQPVVVEEYLPGDEITAAVLGNANPEVFGMMRISPKDNISDFIYSIEQKRSWREKIVYEGENVLGLDVTGRIREYAVRAFRALSLRDVARIDFRVDSEGMPKIIDVNPLPGLSPAYSDLVIMCGLSGKSYTELIRGIMSNALDRYSAEIRGVITSVNLVAPSC
jgi:D-alanine-D-alanine ligase